ncbi:P-loop containing nucleoside triphosphate hydrolase protein [Dunaliella salina]|uniref:P-loop containing nucleoside triphosphate hydrolase protein n=1 Tax=Dunaliella salina TaxID=3046 RepID=A0ABQ7H4N3_DUNSA|nr:P-loop containing nucleoside triphosphate hydrolase protein [Dunaliella salina]|eukprot:KAF5841819.1 P-loop containing nucleoside triphosphate hydrolase protein [Dunaliella salina]
MSAPAGGVASVRVVVRVRPSIRQEAVLADTEPSLLCIDEGSKCISVGKTSEQRVPKQFRFDGVFGPSVSQEQLYKQAGIHDLVVKAAQGFHATVFAYGQTGSGKTYTMEGFNYVSCGVPPAGSLPQAGNQSFSMKAQPPPFADFKGTPPEQLGVVPRVAEALFKELQQASTGRRATVRCSFVQLYKEQAYDLLNPSPTPTTPGLTQGLQTKAGGLSGLGNALRMRWNKAHDFYLENLFKVSRRLRFWRW